MSNIKTDIDNTLKNPYKKYRASNGFLSYSVSGRNKMNMMNSFNRTMDYIESELDGTIDEKEIARLSRYSFPLFSRLFSILTGYTLNEYIRLRKLSRAAADLRNTDTVMPAVPTLKSMPKAICIRRPTAWNCGYRL